MTQHPDEGTLHALVDGELPETQAAELERHVAMCAQCASALAEARGLVAGTSRIVSALDSAPALASRAPEAVAAPIARSTAPGRAARPSLFRVPYLRAAAVLVLAAGSAIVLDRSRPNAGVTATEMAREVDASPRAVDEMENATAQSIEQPPSAPVASAPGTARGVGESATRVLQSTGVTKRGVASASNLVQAREAEAATVVVQRDAQSVPAVARAVEPGVAPADRKEAVALAAPSPLASPPPPPPPAAMSSASDARSAGLAGAVATGTGATRPSRTTRYRLESGVILTLLDEPLDTAAFLRRVSPLRSPASPTAASMAPSSTGAEARINTYRWINTEMRRSYLLTGPVTEDVLKEAASRLGELHRVP